MEKYAEKTSCRYRVANTYTNLYDIEAKSVRICKQNSVAYTPRTHCNTRENDYNQATTRHVSARLYHFRRARMKVVVDKLYAIRQHLQGLADKLKTRKQ